MAELEAGSKEEAENKVISDLVNHEEASRRFKLQCRSEFKSFG